MSEQYIQISRNDAQLSAILHPGSAPVGVLIIVGGPQYRVGSHRQFVKLSRALSQHNIASMRLDSSGMGDSSGSKAANAAPSSKALAVVSATSPTSLIPVTR